MAKGKVTAQIKISFGKRRNGKAKKSYSKALDKPKKYRGQGR
jgi:hypothetical protein